MIRVLHSSSTRHGDEFALTWLFEYVRGINYFVRQLSKPGPSYLFDEWEKMVSGSRHTFTVLKFQFGLIPTKFGWYYFGFFSLIEDVHVQEKLIETWFDR